MSSVRSRSLAARSLGVLALLAVSVVLTLVASPSANAQDADPTTTAVDGAEAPAESGATDEQLTLGAEVFASSCASCHQAGGVGVPGQFPPLKGNANVQDAEHVRTVIQNGLSGELVVNGETFDGVMPAVSGLGEAELDAVVAYVGSDFATPAGGAVEVDPAAGLADGALTGPVNLISTIALLVGLGVAAMVLFPRVAAANDRLETTWLDAWMKVGVIVVGVALLVVLIPNWLMNMSWFSDLDGLVQDLLGSAIWGAGLVAVLWSLWYAHGRDWI